MSQPVEPRQYGSDGTAVDEAPSQALVPVAIPTLLLFCTLGSEQDEICSQVLKAGLRPVHIPKRDLLPPPAVAPQYCLIELSLPGAQEYLAAIATSNPKCLPIAVISKDAPEELLGYQLGAVATLTRPLEPGLVFAILSAQRKRAAMLEQSEVIVEHDRRVVSANAFDGLLRALGQDVRNPLAAALANVEFLSDHLKTQPSPVTGEEQEAIVEDTLSSLQQIRNVLEQVSALIPREPPELKRLHLWSVAQRVIDELPSSTAQVTLVGDSEVRGWGDEGHLVEVATTLVRRALERGSTDGTAKVSIHIYSHDSEARLTVRDPSPPSSERPQRDPFHPGLTLPKPGQSGLLLTAARHAIARMGGALQYVPRTKSGYAFRIRLRIARPDEP